MGAAISFLNKRGQRFVPIYGAYRRPLFCELWENRRIAERARQQLAGFKENLGHLAESGSRHAGARHARAAPTAPMFAHTVTVEPPHTRTPPLPRAARPDRPYRYRKKSDVLPGDEPDPRTRGCSRANTASHAVCPPSQFCSTQLVPEHKCPRAPQKRI